MRILEAALLLLFGVAGATAQQSSFSAYPASGSAGGTTYSNGGTLKLIKTLVGAGGGGPNTGGHGAGTATNIIVNGELMLVSHFGDQTVPTDRKIDMYSIVDPTNPVLVSSVTPHTSCSTLCRVYQPFVFGKFLYFSSFQAWETWDITNLAAPVFVSAILDPHSNDETLGWYGAALIVGQVVYLGSNTRHLDVYDITDRAHPVLLSDQVVPEYSNGPVTFTLHGSVLAWAEIEHGTLFYDVSNPSNPVQLGDGADILPHASYITNILQQTGNILYTGAYGGFCNGSWDDFSCTGAPIWDISNILAPVHLSTYKMPEVAARPDVYFTVDTLRVSGNIMYVGYDDSTTFNCAVACGIDVVDVSDPSNPVKITTFLNGKFPVDVAVFGKYLAAVDFPVNGGLGNIYIYEAPGLKASSLEAGHARAGTLLVDTDAEVQDSLRVGTFLKVGPDGIGSQGPVGGPPGRNGFYCQNYFLSNNGTNWTVNGVAGAAIAASTSQPVKLFSLPSRGRVVSVETKTETAFSGTGFTTFTSTIGDSVGGATFYDPGSYDLAAAVSDTNFQAVGGIFKSATYAGSDVRAVITASANLNSNTITGQSDYEVCWVALP